MRICTDIMVNSEPLDTAGWQVTMVFAEAEDASQYPMKWARTLTEVENVPIHDQIGMLRAIAIMTNLQLEWQHSEDKNAKAN